MDENTKETDAGEPGLNIEEILRERERLERIIQEQFKKEVAILFTDICGYTQFTETRGDIGSRALLQYVRETQPRYHLFGHVHQPLAARTRIGRTECVNVGHFHGSGRPFVLDLPSSGEAGPAGG